jgi:solute carrier family 35 protein F5
MAPAEPMMPADLASPGLDYLAVGSRRSTHPEHGIDMGASVTASLRSLGTAGSKGSSLRSKLGLMGVARRTLGIVLLLVTVLLWTISNFLASVRPPSLN